MLILNNFFIIYLIMENESTEYKEGSGDDFISFLFSSPPKDKNAIKLELSPPASDIQIGLHIFQELLMILTGGIQYLFGDNENKINISKMTEEQVNLLNQYFESIGFVILVERFTVPDYMDNMKLPNYFLEKEKITENTLLKDIYYETSIDYIIYRISFDFIR